MHFPFFIFLLSLPLLTVSKPTVYRSLSPVSANETFMVTGFDLEGVTAVKFCDGQQACSTAPLSLPASLTVRTAFQSAASRMVAA